MSFFFLFLICIFAEVILKVAKVVLGLSDGVDSAVAAYILLKQGYDVEALYLDIAGEEALNAARNSAEQLNISFAAIPVKDELEEKVCKNFESEYLNGHTPSPCVICNPAVKLPALIKRADEIGAEFIATGHYAIKKDGSLYMNPYENDQSYMLARITDTQLKRLLLPLGGRNKQEIRKLAKKLKLNAADRPDSRDNCFCKGSGYIDWLINRNPQLKLLKGKVLYNSDIVAEHEGCFRFTVGQRWKSDIDGRRVYISHIDAAANTLYLDKWEDIFLSEFKVGDLKWLNEEPGTEFECSIRIRHTRRETPLCSVRIINGIANVTAFEPVRAPAPGQAAAFYIKNRLIGGGFLL